jgi:hypothetical protein
MGYELQFVTPLIFIWESLVSRWELTRLEENGTGGKAP